MYWLLLVFIILVAVFWFTSKDRSPAAMVESIVSDFRSKGPDPFEVEAFYGTRPVDPIPYPIGYEPLGI